MATVKQITLIFVGICIALSLEKCSVPVEFYFANRSPKSVEIAVETINYPLDTFSYKILEGDRPEKMKHDLYKTMMKVVTKYKLDGKNYKFHALPGKIYYLGSESNFTIDKIIKLSADDGIEEVVIETDNPGKRQTGKNGLNRYYVIFQYK